MSRTRSSLGRCFSVSDRWQVGNSTSLGYEPQHVSKAVREVETGTEPSAGVRALGGGDIKGERTSPVCSNAQGELVNHETRGDLMLFPR